MTHLTEKPKSSGLSALRRSINVLFPAPLGPQTATGASKPAAAHHLKLVALHRQSHDGTHRTHDRQRSSFNGCCRILWKVRFDPNQHCGGLGFSTQARKPTKHDEGRVPIGGLRRHNQTNKTGWMMTDEATECKWYTACCSRKSTSGSGKAR